MAENLRNVLTAVARRYPNELISDQLRDVDRIAFMIELAGDRGRAKSVCDIGGGVGLFSVGCQSIGIDATLVDDFGDQVNSTWGTTALALHKDLGVTIVSRDVVASGVDFPANVFDVITSFDSMEHWHASPKSLFRQLLTALKPGGLFVLGVPNCVNLRKRITVPFGVGKWSPMDEWYERERFRGHVREPDVADLRYISTDLGLEEVRILGRNWSGRGSRFRWVRITVPLIDRLLQLRPSLCSDLYLVGRKGAAS